jgi:O-antigen/teichoic acid export membrane protein
MKIINTLIRLIASGSKFLLIIILIKYLDAEQYAIYVLIVATIGYLLYPLGIEFYTYSIRELILENENKRNSIYKNQIILHGIIYTALLPLISGLFYFGMLPFKIILWFYLILISEHINQELYRINVALSNQLSASISLFLRQGFWPVILALLMEWEQIERSLESVLIFWLISNLAALAYGSKALKFKFSTIKKEKIDVRWIIYGVNKSIPFLFSALCVNSILFIDKYMINHYYGSDYLASYSIFLSLSLILILIVDAMVVQYSYQRMIILAGDRKITDLLKIATEMIVSIIVLSAIFSLLMPRFSALIIEMAGKSNMEKDIDALYILIAYAVISAIAFVPHCCLYALKSDVWLNWVSYLAPPIFVLGALIMQKNEIRNAIPLSLLITSIYIFLAKTVGVALKIKEKN